MISASRPRADINLARLETLDQEIGAAAKTLPGLKDGKNALEEALEGGKGSGGKSLHGYPSGVHARRGRARSLAEPQYRRVILPGSEPRSRRRPSVVGFFRVLCFFAPLVRAVMRQPRIIRSPRGSCPMIIRRRSLFLVPRPRPPVHGCGSRPDRLDGLVQLRHQLVGARSWRRLDLADAAERVSGQRNPADQYRDRRYPDWNPAWPDHRPRHGARHVLPLLPHHHQHPPGLRIGADPDKRHDLDGRRPHRLRRDHDVPPVVGFLGRAGGRDAGRRMGNRHGAHPLRQRRQGDRPRRHGDRRSDHSRHPHHRPRPHRGRTLPQPHQSGDRFHPDARPDRDGRQRRQGRRRHLRLFAGGRQRNRVSHLRIGFGRQLVGLAGDARRRDDRHGDAATVDPRRHPRHAETPDRTRSLGPIGRTRPRRRCRRF